MADFWRMARLLLERKGILLGTLLFAAISAGGLGAGLLGVSPILDAILGKGSDLPTLAAKWAESAPAWLKPSPETIASLPTGQSNAVFAVVMGLGVLTLVGAAANFLHQYLALTLVSRTVGVVRTRAFEHVVHLPLRTVLAGSGPGLPPPPGSASDSVSRVINDSYLLGAGFNALLSKALAQVAKGVAALAAAFYFNWTVAIVALAVGPILATIIRRLGKTIRRATRAALQGQSGLYHAAGEAVNGLRVVKVHTTEGAEAARFAQLSDEVVRQEMRVRTARAMASPLVETIAIFVLGALVLVATKAILDKTLPARDFILVIGSLGVAGASLKPLTSFLADMQQAGAAAQRLRQLMDLPVEQVGALGGGSSGLPQLPRHARSIVFERVSFTYPGAATPALRDVSLEIPHGSTVAFVGPNGSGKTTVLALIPRLFDPTPPTTPASTTPSPSTPVGSATGRVLVDGVDIATVDLRSLRRQIGVVTQDTVLFRGTIRTNIAYGSPDASDQRVREAARRAHAEEFILAKPQGYDTPLGESGGGLSGGQRQRIAIARAILRDPAILILDEATSSVDNETEAAIQRSMEVVSVGRTTLVIAHRLSTVRSAHRIHVLEHGRIAEAGTHEELLREGGLYAALWRVQTGEALEKPLEAYER